MVDLNQDPSSIHPDPDPSFSYVELFSRKYNMLDQKKKIISEPYMNNNNRGIRDMHWLQNIEKVLTLYFLKSFERDSIMKTTFWLRKVPSSSPPIFLDLMDSGEKYNERGKYYSESKVSLCDNILKLILKLNSRLGLYTEPDSFKMAGFEKDFRITGTALVKSG